MPKCPKCGKEIDYLVNVESGDMDYRFNPDGDYYPGEFLSDGGRNEYECPLCQATLFTDETTALEFLKGTKDTTPAMDIERPITDETAAAIAKEAEEYHKRKEQEELDAIECPAAQVKVEAER